eukprot:scpid54317/ scgid29773/ 
MTQLQGENTLTLPIACHFASGQAATTLRRTPDCPSSKHRCGARLAATNPASRFSSQRSACNCRYCMRFVVSWSNFFFSPENTQVLVPTRKSKGPSRENESVCLTHTAAIGGSGMQCQDSSSRVSQQNQPCSGARHADD